MSTQSRRNSVPSSPRSNNMSNEPITSISIPRFALTQPSGSRAFYAFHITLAGPVRSWTVKKRYSELLALHTKLVELLPKSDPGTPFPPKDGIASGLWGLLGNTDEGKVEERAKGLEEWLKSVVSASDPRWRRSDVWLEFFGLPTNNTRVNGAHGGGEAGSPSLDSRAWLDEHDALVGTASEIRSLVSRRNATGTGRNEALQAGFEAKRLMSNLVRGVETLGNGLKDAGKTGLSRMEIDRRVDMVERLKGQKDELGKMLAMPISARASTPELSANSSASPSFASSTSSFSTNGVDPERSALLGSAAQPTPRSSRKFGNSTGPKTLETDETREQDNGGLLQLQKTKMEEQDSALDSLTSVIRRQKQIAGLIGDELDMQNRMLDELDADVDKVEGRLKSAGKKLDKVLKG